MPFGLFLIDKPSGPTSHDIVKMVRRGIKDSRVGHTGTLDPMATGLLVVLIGNATRLSEYLVEKDKRYLATVRFGQTTNTYDAAGDITSESDHIPTQADIEAALPAFRGAIQQVPPAFSAIKRNGQKMYDLARKGKAVELDARPVTIHELLLTNYAPPLCTLEIHCSSGTYIRSLAHDLGQVLGGGAHLSALRRTQAGNFSVENAVSMDTLFRGFDNNAWEQYVTPADTALPDWESVHLSEEHTTYLFNGRFIPRAPNSKAWAKAYDHQGQFCGILKAKGNEWKPEKVLKDE